eukprot:TRINITY_DN1733_c0_g1_i4.p1 TRINITY_DN1733_c0_g1~~TRINITY_DN1733_c0_g1_i4.p1  ORF type:complete len:172 (+),score=50.65 TRINITY_DN1733_c0_g1_i4:647-1162(+)
MSERVLAYSNPLYTPSQGFFEQSYLPLLQPSAIAPQPMALESVGSSQSGVRSGELEDSMVPKKTAKKEKNRVSAQKCRFRKKQYIESLELRIKELTEELAKCKEELQVLKSNKTDTTTHQDIFNEYKQKRFSSIKQMESMLADSQSEEMLSVLINEVNVRSAVITIDLCKC